MVRAEAKAKAAAGSGKAKARAKEKDSVEKEEEKESPPCSLSLPRPSLSSRIQSALLLLIKNLKSLRGPQEDPLAAQNVAPAGTQRMIALQQSVEPTTPPATTRQ